MKKLFAAIASLLLLLLTAPAVAQCGGDDVGSMPSHVKSDTLLLVSSYAPGTQWWVSDGTTCELKGYVVSPEGIAHFMATGSYLEPSLEGAAEGDLNPPTLESTWTSGGLTHTVRTPKQGGDSSAVWAKKHKTHVDALMALYPPDQVARTWSFMILPPLAEVDEKLRAA